MYAYFDKGEIKKGIKYYKKLSRLSSDNDIYYLPMDIIDSLLIGLDIEDKISLCKKYLEINNMDFNLRKRLINIYKKLQNYSKLEEELIKYLNILPDGIKEYELERGEVYFDLGFCNFKMHNYDKSLKYFKLADSLGISIPIEFYNEINAKINN